jgi:catechol 2,3-dioxygenase-like lactoylglutathione lyase family enzyme
MIGNPLSFVVTAKAEEARRFYEQVLGMRFVADDGFALVFEGLRVAKVDAVTPAQHTVFGFEVADATVAATRLKESGVELVRYPYFEHDALGLWHSPSGARVGWFRDPDGNVLSIADGGERR